MRTHRTCPVLTGVISGRRYAIQHGYDVIPVYHFGETQLYSVLWPFDVPWIVRLRVAIAKRTQVATGVGYGFLHFPLMPDPSTRCRTVVGPRLVLPEEKSIDKEGVVRWHAEYVSALNSLYNEHRVALSAYAHKELEIW